MARLVSGAVVASARLQRAGARARNPGSGWVLEFLRRELAPYPGRGSLVARMVIAVTLTMLIVETFHIPGGALGGFFGLVFARQDLRATMRNAGALALFFCLGTVFLLVTLAMVVASPVTHFLWVIGAFYLVFFVMAAAPNYAYATGFSFTLATAIPLWDTAADTNTKVALSLYTLLSVAIGAGASIVVEAVYRAFRPVDSIAFGMADRLRVVAAVLRAAADGQKPDPQTRALLLQYATVGASTLRERLVRAGERPRVRARAAALIALSDRMVEMCAYALDDLEQGCALRAEDRLRLHALAQVVEHQARQLRTLVDMNRMETMRLPGADLQPGPPSGVTTLTEMERTAFLLSEFSHAPLAVPAAGAAAHGQRSQPALPYAGLLKADAFRNRRYQVFALRGCVATTACYLVYNAADWPGISTALATCIITALGTIGASRQKQALRIVGAAIGGFLIALPAQVYLLPRIDSISAFTLFFAAVTLLAAWIATSSPRLSYLGLQIALAFDLINLQEPYEQLSLNIARDRVIGVLLGLVAMWVVFDQFGGKLAGESMLLQLRRNLELLGELTESLAAGRTAGGEAERRRFRELQGQLSDGFTAMNGQADGILFEFSRSRARHMRQRDRMQAMQPAMRSMFLLLITVFEAAPPSTGGALTAYLERHRQALATIAASGPRRAARLHAQVSAAAEALESGRAALCRESNTLLNLCLSLLSALRALAAMAEAAEERSARAEPQPAPAT